MLTFGLSLFGFSHTPLFAVYVHIEGGSLESFDKKIDKGFYHQVELGHTFYSKKSFYNPMDTKLTSPIDKKNDDKNMRADDTKKDFENLWKHKSIWELAIHGGYFQSKKKFLPALALNYTHFFGSGKFEAWLGSIRKNYRDGFLLSHGGYNDLQKSPLWAASATGVFLHYRYLAFYLDGGYQKHFGWYNEQQFFYLMGFKFFKDVFDVYAGVLYDFHIAQKTASPLLGLEIGREDYLFSVHWSRLTDVHTFLKLKGKKYNIQAGYYQKQSHKKRPEHFSFGFFRDQTQAGYLRLQIYFFHVNTKANCDYQRASVKIGKPIDKWNGRAVYSYSSYSSKSASLTGIYITAPQEKVGFYGGFFWLLPKTGYQMVLGMGMKKVFFWEYNYIENWQQQFASLNPMSFENLVANHFSHDVLWYFSKPVQALSAAVQKNGFSFLLRFVYSWTSETILTRNISAKIAYTKSF